jgi:lipoprotein signal peptidase
MTPSPRDSATAANSPPQSTARACTRVSAWLFFLIPAILGIAGDLWLKNWSFPDGVPSQPAAMRLAGVHPGIDPRTGQALAPQVVIPGVLGFTTTVNQGAVFGIGQGKVAWFLGFSVIALAVIVWVFATSGARQRVVHLALGNMYDRAVHHGVRDMLKFLCFKFNGEDWYPYIFNIADALLCIGVPLLIARWLFVKDDAPIATFRAATVRERPRPNRPS